MLAMELDVSSGNISKKVNNLAKIAQAERMDMCVLQECPGSDLAPMEGAIREILAHRSKDPGFYFSGRSRDIKTTKLCFLIFITLIYLTPNE
jgi:predicted component of type VI protein secretion system